jgi:hypothetical protein
MIRWQNCLLRSLQSLQLSPRSRYWPSTPSSRGFPMRGLAAGDASFHSDHVLLALHWAVLNASADTTLEGNISSGCRVTPFSLAACGAARMADHVAAILDAAAMFYGRSHACRSAAYAWHGFVRFAEKWLPLRLTWLADMSDAISTLPARSDGGLRLSLASTSTQNTAI